MQTMQHTFYFKDGFKKGQEEYMPRTVCDQPPHMIPSIYSPHLSFPKPSSKPQITKFLFHSPQVRFPPWPPHFHLSPHSAQRLLRALEVTSFLSQALPYSHTPAIRLGHCHLRGTLLQTQTQRDRLTPSQTITYSTGHTQYS
jgi:hypothetical protein